MNRIKLICVSREWLEKMLLCGSSHCFRVDEGIPRNSQIVRIDYDIQTGRFWIVVFSPEFPVVAEGVMLEHLNPKFTFI